MENSRVLIYDGSFNGFLTSLHIALENNIEVMGFQKNKTKQEGLFMDQLVITTDKTKAESIWKSLEKKSHTAIRRIYFAFLSEADGIDFMLYEYVRKLYGMLNVHDLEQSALIETKISKLALQVNREKSYTESTVDFQKDDVCIYYAELEPSFNILPLISRHFRYKYPKQHWIIYDNKRQYGVYYNGISLEIISRETKESYLMGKIHANPYLETSYRMAM
ncbi:TIGR03915 family putative DNA repair protein [Maribacter sp. ANRC-HE7]|uniref:TIGR03915 family putative DNA repair protein n=1 Tax=Maribacter aquimaris TaxID=2737171 RepID=A0ABR7UVL8_9FLAO|nr:TIGR03915 family putative DNA repair protein [Maribacter aquimaris]MBD0776460.1 TIGR03915 family putative DNA repair protein [Maribacter aquimaris]